MKSESKLLKVIKCIPWRYKQNWRGQHGKRRPNRMRAHWLSSVLHEYVGEEDLEVKHQAGNQVTPLSDIHCACMGERLGPPQSTCSLASMHLTHGTTQDLEDTVYSPCVKCGSQTNHCSPLFHLVTNRRLLLGHRPIARSSPREDHRRALNAELNLQTTAVYAVANAVANTLVLATALATA